jgi:hypothetical protein
VEPAETTDRVPVRQSSKFVNERSPVAYIVVAELAG